MQNYENIYPFLYLRHYWPTETEKNIVKNMCWLCGQNVLTTKKAIHTDYFMNIIQQKKYVDF